MNFVHHKYFCQAWINSYNISIQYWISGPKRKKNYLIIIWNNLNCTQWFLVSSRSTLWIRIVHFRLKVFKCNQCLLLVLKLIINYLIFKLFSQFSRCGLIESYMGWYQFRNQRFNFATFLEETSIMYWKINLVNWSRSQLVALLTFFF